MDEELDWEDSREKQRFFDELNEIYDRLHRLANKYNVVYSFNIMFLNSEDDVLWDGMMLTKNVQHDDILAFNIRQLNQLQNIMEEQALEEIERLENEEEPKQCIYQVQCINDKDVPNFLKGTIKKGMIYTVQNIVSLKDGKFAYYLTETGSKHSDFNGYQSNLFKIITNGDTYSGRN